MREASIALVLGRQPAEPEIAHAIPRFAREELQQGCRSCKKMKIPPMHCGSGGFTNLAGEVGLLGFVNSANALFFCHAILN